MLVSTSERLIIRHFDQDDTDYILRQLNEASFIRFIADKKVRTQDAALAYLNDGPLASYKVNGFGLNAVVVKESQAVIGMCGLIKRDELELPDLGFAFLPEHWGKGYAYEASVAVLHHAFTDLALDRVLSITMPENDASNQLLRKLGFSLKGTLQLYNAENNLYEYRENS